MHLLVVEQYHIMSVRIVHDHDNLCIHCCSLEPSIMTTLVISVTVARYVPFLLYVATVDSTTLCCREGAS